LFGCFLIISDCVYNASSLSCYDNDNDSELLQLALFKVQLTEICGGL